MDRSTAPMASSDRPASIQNGPRHPVSWPAKVPSGTPAATARLSPPDITASARALAPGPATAVATTAPVAQNVRVTSVVTTRDAVTTANESLSAATTCPAANTASAPTSVAREGRRSVASAITGGPTIIPTANAVTRSPARATSTPRSAAASGSKPAIMNSVVPIRKMPAAIT